MVCIGKSSKHHKAHRAQNGIEQDGLRGWVVVLAAFMTHLLTQGIVYSYGILLFAFEDTFGGNKAKSSWIVSIMCGALYLSDTQRVWFSASLLLDTTLFSYVIKTGLKTGFKSLNAPSISVSRPVPSGSLSCFGVCQDIEYIRPLASIFLRRHGSWLVAYTGAILSAIGCFLTVFAYSLYFMYLSLGLITGVGYGLIYIPAVVEVTVYFKKHRALACGIAASGAGAAAFGLSPIVEFILETYTWRGTMLIWSGLLLNCVQCSLIFRNKFTTEDATNIETNENDNQPDIIDGHGDKKGAYIKSDPESQVNEVTADVNTDKLYGTKISEVKKGAFGKVVSIKTDNLNSGSVTERMLQKPNERSFSQGKDTENSPLDADSTDIVKRACYEPSDNCLLYILREKEMMLFYASQILFYFGFFLPMIGIPGIAIEHSIVETKAVWIISVIGISTAFGRVALGYLSDRPFMNSLLLYKVACLVAGISTTCVPILTKYIALVIYAITYGISTAVMLSQTSVVLVEIIGLGKMSDAMGLNNMFCGVGALIGPPLLGLSYDQTGRHKYPFIIAGLSMALD